jgi:uncharacterized protein (TIGR00251 family)
MIIRVQVKPNSKTDSIDIGEDGVIQVKICVAPVEGKANNYLVKYLSVIFKIPRSKIEMIKGHHSSHKTLLVNADEDYIKDILSQIEN